MGPVEVAPQLYLVPLDQNLPGFTAFIGAWIFKGSHTFLVDVGPAATVPILLKSIKALKIRHLDAILLTHIHIDHAGGTGDLVAHFPDTPVVCHESGIRHLADPARLWEGSLKTLGRPAEAYGPIRPVAGKLLYDAAQYRQQDVEPIPTPGHAPHHVSFLLGPYLFAGEAGGVFIDLGGKDVYLRPATPPKFHFETYLQSIDSLLAKKPTILCYGHYGISQDAVGMLTIHRKQLLLWKQIITQEFGRAAEKDFLEVCFDRLISADPCLKSFSRMDAPVQDREKGFMQNSIRGFAGYLCDMLADAV
ncbi:MAG: MBL fold metallo-hydrolase [Pseudomonadota bacterium]|uniref:MBL fold metallo-hydrolase n=1 Tax=Candidatus Desulfatibia profunda TaxID=2841695 RepID=A0A8J6NVH2_9BACT|nr:MBL fold metallo-hydrolase [Candidatus Desulfatibia profunda]MBL7178963.1 MBL fold metallo-hydrolase [Desulfobacterales bacterium]MBU0698816.1 MBL fold metallo-hydrolase [Pseudomonadota bacterium]